MGLTQVDRERWSELVADVDATLRHQLTVAFLGSASAGKDAAIRALFGVDFGEVDPIPGSTDRVRVASLGADGRFVVVNAPGFGDIRAEVDALARERLEHLDLVVYVVNAEGGATIDERRDLEAIRTRGDGTWPTLVCLNKIDLIRPHQRPEFIDATLRQLNVPRSEAVACAFDPLPQLSAEPLHLDKVVSWIEERLRERGKELLFAKQLRDKRLACQPIIRTAARRAAVAGAVPIPGADITALTWVQVRMVVEIAEVHGQKLDDDVVMWLVGELLAGGTKGFIRWALEALKAAGWLPGAQLAQAATAALGSAVAAGATYGVGEAAIRFIQSDRRLSIAELREVFDTVAFRKSRELSGDTSAPLLDAVAPPPESAGDASSRGAEGARRDESAE